MERHIEGYGEMTPLRFWLFCGLTAFVFMEGPASGQSNYQEATLDEEWRNQHPLSIQFDYPHRASDSSSLVFLGKRKEDFRFTVESEDTHEWVKDYYGHRLIISKPISFELNHISVRVDDSGVHVNGKELNRESPDVLVYSDGKICRGMIMWDNYSNWGAPRDAKFCYPPKLKKARKNKNTNR
jgi:hypothetical protein